jgi:acyl-CoA thioesterase I
MIDHSTALRLTIIQLVGLGLISGTLGGAEGAETRCTYPSEVINLQNPLPRTTARLNANGGLKIVALGSSSTAGVGATTSEASYPVQLRLNLATQLPDHDIMVVNRGRNGDRVGDMLARLPLEVFPERPDLIIWQLGTNALLTDLVLNRLDSLLLRGVQAITATGADLIIMDPQYAPKVLAHSQTEDVVRLIDGAALQIGAALFRRFDLMRFWYKQHLGFEQFLSADQLHMNDWSYACLAKALAFSILNEVSSAR